MSDESVHAVPFQSKELDSLSKFLEFEITRIRNEESRPGWTRWALLGSLAGAFWLIGEELGSTSVSIQWQSVYFLILAGCIAYEVVKLLFHHLAPREPVDRFGSRFYSTRVSFSGARGWIVAEFGYWVALMVIVCGMRSLIHKRLPIALYTFCGIMAAIYLLIFFSSFFRLLVSVAPSAPSAKRIQCIVCLCLTVAGAFSLGGLLYALLSKVVSPTIVEWRISGLAIALVLILRLLARDQTRTPLLKTLIDVRRGLALGQVDVESAKRQTEIALLGMGVADVLEDDISELVTIGEDLGAHLEKGTQKVGALTALVDAVSTEDAASAQNWLVSVRALKDSLGVSVQDAHAAIKSYEEKFARFKQCVGIVMRLSNQSDREMHLLLDRLQLPINKRGLQMDKLMKLGRQLVDSLDSLPAFPCQESNLERDKLVEELRQLLGGKHEAAE